MATGSQWGTVVVMVVVFIVVVATPEVVAVVVVNVYVVNDVQRAWIVVVALETEVELLTGRTLDEDGNAEAHNDQAYDQDKDDERNQPVTSRGTHLLSLGRRERGPSSVCDGHWLRVQVRHRLPFGQGA